MNQWKDDNELFSIAWKELFTAREAALAGDGRHWQGEARMTSPKSFTAR